MQSWRLVVGGPERHLPQDHRHQRAPRSSCPRSRRPTVSGELDSPGCISVRDTRRRSHLKSLREGTPLIERTERNNVGSKRQMIRVIDHWQPAQCLVLWYSGTISGVEVSFDGWVLLKTEEKSSLEMARRLSFGPT